MLPNPAPNQRPIQVLFRVSTGTINPMSRLNTGTNVGLVGQFKYNMDNATFLEQEFRQVAVPVSFITQQFTHLGPPASALMAQTNGMATLSKQYPENQTSRQVMNLKHPALHRFY